MSIRTPGGFIGVPAQRLPVLLDQQGRPDFEQMPQAVH